MVLRNLLNRRTRTRIYGGVAGESGRPLPLCRLSSEFESFRVILLHAFSNFKLFTAETQENIPRTNQQ